MSDIGSKGALESLHWALRNLPQDTHENGHTFTVSADCEGWVHDSDCEACEAERVSRAAEQDLNRGTGQDTW